MIEKGVSLKTRINRWRWSRPRRRSPKRYNTCAGVKCSLARPGSWRAFQGEKFDRARARNGWTNKCTSLLCRRRICEGVTWSTFFITYTWVLGKISLEIKKIQKRGRTSARTLRERERSAYDKYFSQFVISPKSLDKEIKLQIPIVLATYPLRPEGAPAGTAPSKRGAHYPSTLPIFRPWLDDKAFEIQE